MQYIAFISAIVFLGLWVSYINRKIKDLNEKISSIKYGITLKSLHDMAGED